jgi:hypothetical protein
MSKGAGLTDSTRPHTGHHDVPNAPEYASGATAETHFFRATTSTRRGSPVARPVDGLGKGMARVTGLEPATSGVTGHGEILIDQQAIRISDVAEGIERRAKLER